MIDFSWVNAPLEGAALWLTLWMFFSAVFAGFMWAADGFPLRRKREEPGTRKVTRLERKVLAEMDRIEAEYLIGNPKLTYNPALIDRIYHDEKFLVLSGHGIERWIKNDPECPTPTPSEEPDRWAEFHRDCLDLDMDLQAFADKWHGKVPKKPAPVAMNGGWYLGGERIGNVCSHNAVAHECQKCHEIAFNACALQRRYDEAKAKLTEKRRRIIEETEAMLVTPPPPPPVGTHTLRHEANKPGSYKLACSGPGCVRCKRPDQYTYEWMP